MTVRETGGQNPSNMVKSMRFRTLNATGGLGVQSLARGLGGLGCIGARARGFRAMTKMCMWCCGCDIGGSRDLGGVRRLDRGPNLAGYAQWELQSVQSPSFIRGFSGVFQGLSEFRTDTSEVAE